MADAFLKSLHRSLFEDQESFWNTKGKPANYRTLDNILKSVKITHFFGAHKLPETGQICLKQAVPIFWHFQSITANIYFYLVPLAFTKWTDFFHNKRSWCKVQWLSEFKQAVWIE